MDVDDPNDLLFYDALDSLPPEPPLPEPDPPTRVLRRRRSFPASDPTAPIAPTASSSSSAVTCDSHPPPDPPSLPKLLLALAADPPGALGGVWSELRRRVGRWLAIRLAVGALWAAAVGIALLWCLAMAFVVGRLVVVRMVEKPLRIEEELVFDYTKESPLALVPVGFSCGVSFSGGLEKEEKLVDAPMRVVAVGNSMAVRISLTMPESDYNRNLGVFQVRADFLSLSGRIIASSSRPCMLQFKSSLVRFLQTLLKSGLLLAGYTTESQILIIEMKNFIEKPDPTACIRVAIQSRAQFQHGTGIPEIYAASLVVESELPLFKRILWSWRRTIFIWISLGIFLSELLIILLCCIFVFHKMSMRSAT